MAESTITVSGGAGGIGAQLDDMRTESAQLSAMAQQLIDQSLSAAGIALDVDLLASAVLSPITAAAAEQQIVFATGQMLLFATEAGVTAVFLAGAVDAYEAVDASLALLADAAVNSGTFVVGVMAVPLAVGAGLVAAIVVPADVALVYIVGYGVEGVVALHEGINQTLANPAVLVSPGLAVAMLVANTADAYDVDAAQDLVNKELAGHLAQLNALAGDNAWVVDLIAQGAPGLLTGLTLPLSLILGPVGANVLLTKLTGVPWPPTSYEQAVQAIIGAGNQGGYFDDGPLLTDADLFEPPAITGQEVVVPTNVSTLFDGSSQIDSFDALGDDEDSFARIRITEVPGTPPSFIVQIPSTQSWAAAAGSTPNDVTSDTHAMLAQQTALSSAVDAAMQRAGITPDNPVMLQGFSLGGITAGQMAADPTLNYNITNIVTGGSPIANFDIPADVQVLALEFDDDPVAKLDGNDNPDSANWSTVHATAPSLSTDNGVPVGIGGDFGAHNSDRYAVTGAEVDASTDSSITAWTDSAGNFFGGTGPATTTDYGAKR